MKKGGKKRMRDFDRAFRKPVEAAKIEANRAYREAHRRYMEAHPRERSRTPKPTDVSFPLCGGCGSTTPRRTITYPYCGSMTLCRRCFEREMKYRRSEPDLTDTVFGFEEHEPAIDWQALGYVEGEEE